MKTADLTREIELAVDAVREPHLKRMMTLGVSRSTVARLGAVQPPFGVMNCEDIGGGIFQTEGDTPYIAQPVYEDGILIDIVAWRTTEPRRWLCRTGSAWAINPDIVVENSWGNEPLTIDATPLDWLRNGAVGLCILDWDAPEIRQLLRTPSIVTDKNIVNQLRSTLLKPPYCPDIRTRDAQKNAA
ncbi:hypothetical protein [Parasphingorhabdus sp.]|uniref:hypothetical protein n=1 Tax=Parasphingorhabdus sp. TaxID=2709688 RepID=UPI002F930FE6